MNQQETDGMKNDTINDAVNVIGLGYIGLPTALMLASQQVFSLQTAILVGALGGLMEDLLCENMIGLTPALCLIAAVIYESCPRTAIPSR